MIKSASRSSITSNEKYRSMSVGNVPSSEFLIQTIEVGATPVPEIIFNNLAQFAGVYRHLQIVTVGRSAQTGSSLRGMGVRLNGVTTASYAWHILEGAGGTVQSFAGPNFNNGYIGHLSASQAPAEVFGVSIIDILDPFNTNKTKTLRGLSGGTSPAENRVRLYSTLFNSTSVVNSISLFGEDMVSNFTTGSRFSLYGVTA